MSNVFTDSYLKSLKAPVSNTIRVWDGISDPDLKGFGLSISKSGNKSFLLYYTSPETGKRRYINIGNYPHTGLAEARRLVRKHRESIRIGIDPQERKKRQIQAEKRQAAIGTVRQLFELYIKDMELQKKRSVRETINTWKKDISPVIGDKRARDVTKDDILDVITPIVERGATAKAHNTRAMLSAAFNFGLNIPGDARWRNKAPDFQLEFNPVSAIKKPARSKTGERYLTKQEVHILWNSIGVEAMHQGLALAIKLLLATGQRVEEVLQAEWSEFDIEDKVWTIPAARRKMRDKQTEPHIVPLTTFHFKLLEEIKSFSGSRRWLFPHQQKRNAPRTCDSLSQAVRRYCHPEGKSKRKSFTPFTPRDLRRTWKTLAESIGLGLEIRNRIQGHSIPGVGSLHYDRHDYLKEKRKAMNVWCKWLEKQVKVSSL